MWLCENLLLKFTQFSWYSSFDVPFRSFLKEFEIIFLSLDEKLEKCCDSIFSFFIIFVHTVRYFRVLVISFCAEENNLVTSKWVSFKFYYFSFSIFLKVLVHSHSSIFSKFFNLSKKSSWNNGTEFTLYLTDEYYVTSFEPLTI